MFFLRPYAQLSAKRIGEVRFLRETQKMTLIILSDSRQHNLIRSSSGFSQCDDFF